MSSRRLVADSALLFVAFIWGLTFVMVQDAVRAYPVFAFLATRFLFALLGLLPIIVWRRKDLRPTAHESRLSRQVAASVLTGAFLFAGYSFQTAGLLYTTPAKAAFITGLGVTIVPLLSIAFGLERLSLPVLAGVVLAVVGLGFLTLSGSQVGGGLNLGDLLVLGCAISFAAQIFAVGRFAPRMNPLLFTTGQLATVMALAGMASLLFERGAPWPPAGQPLFAALFTGLLATALAFGVQTAAQRFTTATHTALIFATEPVFGALGSYLLIQEVLTPAQLLGSALILSGMLAAEMGQGFLSWGRRLRTANTNG